MKTEAEIRSFLEGVEAVQINECAGCATGPNRHKRWSHEYHAEIKGMIDAVRWCLGENPDLDPMSAEPAPLALVPISEEDMPF